MDKIKKVFSPGSSKDDEVLYGDPNTRAAQSTEQQQTAPLHPVQGSEKKEHGVLRQIVNPGGDKFDDQRYGTTASTEVDPNAPPIEHHGKEHTVTQQILNPGGHKYDERRFSATADTTAAGAPAVDDSIYRTDTYEKKHEHSVLRQIINPRGSNYDREGYGATAHVVDNPSTHTGGTHAATAASYHQSAATGATGVTAVPGSTTTSGFTGADDPSKIIDRPHPLAGTQAVNETAVPTSSTLGGPASTVAPRGETGVAGRNAAVLGSGALPAGTAVSNGRAIPQSATRPSATTNPTDLHVPGEFPTATGEDRHAHTGQNLGSGSGGGATATGLAGVGTAHSTTSSYPSTSAPRADANTAPTATNPLSQDPEIAKFTQSSSEGARQHHYGRDAAVAGGAGALGAGAYEATHARGSTGPASQTTGPRSSNVTNAVDPRGQSSIGQSNVSTTTAQQNPYAESGAVRGYDDGHHAGRDAGVAAGVGAASAGVYDTTHTRGDTGPASKTIGPHERNVANIVDPRVQPDPSKMKDHTTAGPYHSDTLNKLDPRVQSDPAKASEQQRGHGAAGAGVADAGAGAVAAEQHQHGPEHGHEHEHEHEHKQHNKLHKERKDGGDKDDGHSEKKPGLLHRMLHPGHSGSKSGGGIDEPTQKQLHQEEIQQPFSGPPPMPNATTAADAKPDPGAVLGQGVPSGTVGHSTT